MDVKASVHCLPSQLRFINSDHKHPFFIGGLGVGKSSGIAKRCLNLIQKRHQAGIKAFIFVASLTSSLANDTVVPEIQSHLEEYNLSYRWVASPDVRKFRVYIQDTEHIIKIVSMDKPETSFVGYNATDGILDEFDVLPEHKKKLAWKKALGRTRKKFFLRDSKGNYLLSNDGKKLTGVPTLAIATTPEYKGFTEYLCVRSAYEDENGKTLTEKREPIAEYIRAETEENPFLSDDYLDTLKLNLDPKRFSAYTKGYFENFQGERVWEYFDEDVHVKDDLAPLPLAFSGWDFGWNDDTAFIIGTMNQRGDVRIHAEYSTRKTLISDIIDKYKDICNKLNIFPVVDYCDPAGNQHDEKSGTTNIKAMRSLGLNPKHRQSRIVEGIIIGNNLFNKNRIEIERSCKAFIDMLNNHSYEVEKNGTRSETPLHDKLSHYSALFRYFCINEFRKDNDFWSNRRVS